MLNKRKTVKKGITLFIKLNRQTKAVFISIAYSYTDFSLRTPSSILGIDLNSHFVPVRESEYLS